MKSKRWIFSGVVLLALSCGATAQGNGHGHGHGHDKHEDSDDQDDHPYYGHEEQEHMRDWYQDNRDHLPPGLAKKDRLPPGLEKQLYVRGTLPPGLRKKMMPCPEEIERRLPPPPPGCAHVVIGGHVVLVNQANFMVMDIFHFELQ